MLSVNAVAEQPVTGLRLCVVRRHGIFPHALIVGRVHIAY